MLLQLDRQMITLAVQLNLGASAGRAGRPQPAAVANPPVRVDHDGVHGAQRWATKRVGWHVNFVPPAPRGRGQRSALSLPFSAKARFGIRVKP